MTGPSRDMLLAKKSLVESEISSLQTMIAFSDSNKEQATESLNELKKSVTAASEEQKKKTEEAMKARQECMMSNTAQSTATKPDEPSKTEKAKDGSNSELSSNDDVVENKKPTTDSSGDDGTDNSGDDGKNNSGDDGTDNSGDDGKNNSGDDGKKNSGDDGTDNSGDDGKNNSGDDGKKNSGDDGTDNSGGKAPISDACKKLRGATESAVDSTFTQAQVNSQYQTAAFTLNSDKKYNSFLNARVSSLQKELKALESELKDAKPYMGPIADSRDFQDLQKARKATEQSLDDEWLQFEYDSDSSHASTSQETTSVNAALGLSYNTPAMSVGGEVNVGYSSTDLKRSLSSASMQVSGELLRVTVKRPWFKPSIFDDTSLSYVS